MAVSFDAHLNARRASVFDKRTGVVKSPTHQHFGGTGKTKMKGRMLAMPIYLFIFFLREIGQHRALSQSSHENKTVLDADLFVL